MAERFIFIENSWDEFKEGDRCDCIRTGGMQVCNEWARVRLENPIFLSFLMAHSPLRNITRAKFFIFNFDFFFDQENYEEEFYNYRACLKIWIFSEAWINFYSFFPLYLIEWNFFTTINHLNFRIGYFRGSLDKFYDFFSSCLIEWNFYYRLSKLVRIG